MPEISVVILTWNRKDDLVEAIESVLMQQGVSFDIIVVDSASTDCTRELIANKYPQVKYVALPYNLGVVGGRNIGMANASGEVVSLLDDDAVLPRPDVLKAAYEQFQRDPELGVLFGPIYDFFDGHIANAVASLSPDFSWSKSFYAYTFAAGGSFIRRELLDDIGYFEPLFFREQEEQEFSLRVHARGKRILYSPTVAIRHKTNVQRFASGEVQCYRLLHGLVTLWRYYPLLDALAFSSWDVISACVRSIKDRWLGRFVHTVVCLVFYHLPLTIVRRRTLLSRDEIAYTYALRVNLIRNCKDLKDSRSSFLDYCRTYLAYVRRGR